VATGGSSNPTPLIVSSEEFPHLRLCIAAYALQIAAKTALFAHDNLFGASQHIVPYTTRRVGESRRLAMKLYRLILLSIAACSVAMTGLAADTETAKRSALGVYPLSTDAIVGYDGSIFGADADSRERALLNQIGLPQ